MCRFNTFDLYNAKIFQKTYLKNPSMESFELTTTTVSTQDVEVIPLSNSMIPNPNLLLLTNDLATHPTHLLFTHNSQIKNWIASIILDNGSLKNLFFHCFLTRLQLPITVHPSPYQVGCLYPLMLIFHPIKWVVYIKMGPVSR
jgi:hypothetical protein